ncbi:MAG: TIGR02117 family protein [Marinobacter sp.]|uniref:TIGR02117 family protein n=1 Tax=Marinobacter sp. TaxID=50741 RepID=UPI00299E7817|nr:TIGR02117 family protein [Marinobacter sp.]MDX1755740.1 TIGR02117 family protein [Marinobacter sp.]
MKAIGVLFMLFGLSGCTGLPHAIEPDARAGDARTIRLYVVGHGWHVGLMLAADHLDPMVPQLKDRFHEAAYYELGWGDEAFYQAQEITTGLTLQAIFWSRGAVMHVASIPVSPVEYFPVADVVDTCLTNQEAESLTRYLASGFSRDDAGRLIELKRGLYGDSQFYEGEGRYHLLNTSNKWAAKGLKSAGMEIWPMFNLTADSVMAFVKENRKDCAM